VVVLRRLRNGVIIATRDMDEADRPSDEVGIIYGESI